MRLFLTSLLTTLLLITQAQAGQIGPGTGPTGEIRIDTVNETKYEAWVDISTTANSFAAWKILKAYCLKPNSNYAESYPRGVEVRVRGEIKLHGCASGTHKVVYVVHNTMQPGDHFRAIIVEPSPNAFGMRWEP